MTTAQKERIERNIEGTLFYREARNLVNLLSEIYEIEVDVKFRNLESKSFHRISDGNHKIVFGYQMLKNSFTEGIYDKYLTGEFYTGIAAVKMIAAHEFAHVLQLEQPGGRTYGSVHNNTFRHYFREILDLIG